jgi:putative transposase
MTDGQGAVRLDDLDRQLVGQLMDRVRSEGLQLTGEDGLLGQLTKMIIESVAEGELDERLDYGKHDPAGHDGRNSRNGARTKTVLTDIGPVEVDIPRDRDGTFEPQIVRKRWLSGIDGLVILLSAKGLTHGEITAHLAEVYGTQVSKQTITGDHRPGSRGHERVAEPATGPGVSGGVPTRSTSRFATGNVATGRIYVAWRSPWTAPVTCWACEPVNTATGKGAKYWQRVCSEIKNRNRGANDRVHRSVRRLKGAARRDRQCVTPGDHPKLRYSLATQQF